MEELTDGELLQTRAALKDRLDMTSLPLHSECMKDVSRAISKTEEELRTRDVKYGY